MITLQKDTKRTVLAQVLVCMGCCCGKVERGKPEVPLEWIKSEWKKQGLLRHVQLTITGCLGPCDIPNVVEIVHREGTVWLGGITRQDEYQSLLDWALRSKEAGSLQELPEDLRIRRVSNPILACEA